MDFSQLPKMSKTPPAAGPGDDVRPTGEARPADNAGVGDGARRSEPAGPGQADLRYEPRGYPEPAASGASIWISLVVGVLCLLMGLNFGRWLAATLAGRSFDTGVLWSGDHPLAGRPVGYFDLQGGTAWTETGLFAMGVALLLDAGLMLSLLRGRRPPLAATGAAVAVTGVALLLNVALGAYLFTLGIVPIVSLIMVLVAGFVLFDHLPMMRRR